MKGDKLMILEIILLVVGFVAGVLVGRNNRAKVETTISTAEQLADKAKAAVKK
jgi:hypothetical protein